MLKTERLNDKQIFVKPTQLLAKPLEDYLTKQKRFAVKEHEEKNLTYIVGVVYLVGEELPREWLGAIVYYHNAVDVLRIDNEFTENSIFHLVPEDYRLLVRTDQSENNY